MQLSILRYMFAISIKKIERKSPSNRLEGIESVRYG